ncbi:cupin domain-containing protein [Burkholderia sp. Ac-20384]|uniref:cupin domain-containing protein n=1 Tax=Burkholderia sp. Ac-20384 TaxID=2703902 RepID=UPI00197D8662|nr:cupin domain-containing protein [Burkholderia sp. Ac-20384]MBN3825099.1 cupin domain-containing protein [Burkholderia sp. Ac-20384]
MHIIDITQLTRESLPGLEHVTLAGNEQGLTTLSVWRQSIEPGAVTPPHRHDCEEVIVIEAGHGSVLIDGETRGFGPGSTLVIPRNEVHQIVNDGPGPITLLAMLGMSPVKVFLPDGTALPLPWKT